MTQAELFLDELRFLCEQAEKIDDFATVSPFLYEFAVKFLKDPLLQPANAELTQQFLEDCALFHSLIKKIKRKLISASRGVKLYIKQSSIENPLIINELPALQNYTELSVGFLYLQHFALLRVLNILATDTTVDHRAFVKQYASIEKNNQIKSTVLSADFKALEEELHCLNRLKGTQAWHSRNEMENFCNIFNPKIYAELKQVLQKNKQPFNLFSLDVRYNGLCKAIDPGIDPQLREQSFKPSYYKPHMQRLYQLAKRKLLLTGPVLIKKVNDTKKYMVQWDDENARLIIDAIPLPKLMRKKVPAMLIALTAIAKQKKHTLLDL